MSTKKRIWLSSPHMVGEEISFIEKAFEENWIAPLGPNVNGFEQDLENYLNDGKAVVLSSGTAAIHLALILLGVQQSDYVIASSFTFSATVNPIKYLNAVPVLVDSETKTWNMDPELLEEAISSCIKKGKKPKAVIVVHLYGMPAQMEKISHICDKYEIPVIEDAAEALGSEYKGKKLGTFGAFGVLSFNGNKIITTSGGGALICRNDEDARKARFLATQAKDEAPHYQHSTIGYNYRMSNIVAGIGRGQMIALPSFVKRRREINEFYRRIFSNVEGVKLQSEPEKDYFSNYWLTSILFDSKRREMREQLIKNLSDENIECRPLWKPMHLQPVFQNEMSFLNGISKGFFKRGLCLPSGSNLKNRELDKIDEVIKRTVS